MNIGLFAETIYTAKGGIERATSNLSAWLASRGHSCTIYCIGNGNGMPQYKLHPEVRTCCLRFDSYKSFVYSRELVIKHNLDVFCGANSTFTRFWFLRLCNNTGIPLLLSERCSPREVESLFMTRRQRLASFFGADGIHLLSEKYLDSLPDFLRCRATVIPNAVPPLVPIDWNRRDSLRKIVLGVGRLDEGQKRFSLLIRAFAMLAERFPDWDCRICGGGASLDDYKHLIEAYGLEGRVQLLGTVNDMDAQYATANIFCMPSAFEGSPNALLEAQAYGLASVGFKDCGGVNDIIVDGENGILVEERSYVHLANALLRLMEDDELRMKYSMNAQNMAYRYDRDVIYSMWENLLARTAECKGNTRLNIQLIPECEEDARLCLNDQLYLDKYNSQYMRAKSTVVAKLRSKIYFGC